jgi:ATP-dependent exoDNAse (exonuclease V) beta subunit
MNKLLIYSASAGSGKTFRLTGNVLNTLINRPDDYKNILAVTFTRKASEEMKIRLLEELHHLASGNKSDYLTELINNTKFSEKEIRNNAKHAITGILHHYSRFSYNTIDSFFQKIYRGFLREANIYGNYELQLDTEQVTNHAVNIMLDDAGNNTMLRNWIMKLIEDQLQEKGNWKIQSTLNDLFKEVYKERFQGTIPEAEKANTFETLETLNKYCASERKRIEHETAAIADKVIKLTNSIGLQPEDFKFRDKSAPKIISKSLNGFVEPSTRVIKACTSDEEWISKTSEYASIITPLISQLKTLTQQLCEHYSNNEALYFSCKLVQSQLFYLGLMMNARAQVDKYLNENNQYLLSDVTAFIAALTVNNDAPFVYEKTGAYIKHYLIDEFQDTSNIQWTALKPLMDECLSQYNQKGMIVGDVKQSIYRWRNGNWRLLGEKVPQQFNATPLLLNDNYRSCSEIVKFNNSIFSASIPILENYIATHLEQNKHIELLPQYEGMFKTNYKDVVQNIKKKDGGWIKVQFFSGKKKEEWQKKSLERCMEIIEELQLKGTSPGDIAILVRKNKDGEQIASYILDYARSPLAKDNVSYRIVSNEALLLSSSYTIKIITGIFHFILDTNNIPSLLEAAVLYQKYYNQNFGIINEIPIKPNEEQVFQFFPKDFGFFCKKAKQFPLFELGERLIKILKLNEDRDAVPFLEAFSNLCLDFTGSNYADLNLFLEWWHLHKDKQKLQLPEDPKAIKIITIHKSKGLGFEHVLLPFCDWSLSPLPTHTIWCKTNNEPFNTFSAYPLKTIKDMTRSYFYQDYFDEFFNEAFDNINMLYVALTRAKTGLYIGAQEKNTKASDKKETVSSINHIINLALENHGSENPNMIAGFDTYFTNNCLEIGEITVTNTQIHQETETPIYPIFLPEKQIKIRKTFDNIDDKHNLNQGRIYHKIFEQIATKSDIENSVHCAYAEGLIELEEIQSIIKNITEKMDQELPSTWFSGFENLLNERWLLLRNGSYKRPDRAIEYKNKWVVVDYKFGYIKKHDYINQVTEYVRVLEQITNKPVIGYVWYVFLNEIDTVN